MPQNDDQDVTHQDVDVDVTNDAAGNSDDGSDDQGDEPFLVVNDRQQYKTREEAVRAYTEAGSRIAQLTAWEKDLDRYGVKDPRVAAQLFDELISLRQEREKAQKDAQSAAGADKSKSGTSTDDDAELSKEDKAALKWLQKHAPRLGFVPKEELQTLKKDFEDFKTSTTQGTEAAQEERRQTVIADGKNSVTQLLTADKISDTTGAKANMVETLITAWINQDEARTKKFWMGGVVTQTLLKEGYDLVKKELGWGQATQQNDAAAAALNKGRALQRNRTLPKTGAAGKGSNQNDGVRKDAAGRKDHIGSVHDAAWQVAEKHFAGRSGA
jgi:hypothetical protein